MAMQFPASPATNDEYTLNGLTWYFDGNGWRRKASISDAQIARLPKLSHKWAGTVASPISSGSGGSGFVLIGKPTDIVYAPNLLVDGTAIEMRVRIHKAGSDPSGYFQLHIGPNNNQTDTNVLSAFGGVIFAASDPIDSTWDLLISYKGGRFSTSLGRRAANISGADCAHGETSNYLNPAVTNYVNLVVSNTTASGTYKLLFLSHVVT